MCGKVSEVEENTLRVLLSTLRKHDPETLRKIIFDVMLAGLEVPDVHIFLSAEADDDGSQVDNPIVESVVIAIRGTENAAKFFKALEAANLDEAEDTELS